MRKLFTLVLIILWSLISCKKTDTTSNNPDPIPVFKTTYLVDSLTTKPSSFVTLTANHAIIKDTAIVNLGTAPIQLIKLDSLHYFFMTPVLDPGKYDLDLKNVNAANIPTVTIGNYTSITNSDALILQVKTDFNNLVDTLKANSFNNSVTVAEAAFLHQLMDQIIENLKNCTSQQKLAIAYQLQNINLDKSIAKSSPLDSAFVVFRLFDFGDEISSQMTQKAKEGAVFTVGARIAATSVAFSSSGIIFTGGTPFSIASLLVSYTAYKLLLNAATERNAEAAAMIGVAFDNFSSDNGTGTSVNPLVINSGQSALQKLIGKLRTLQKSDKTSGFNIDISNDINESEKSEQSDNSLKTKFDNIKAQFSNFFVKISSSYITYISPFLAVAKQKIAEVKSKYISITNVSNPDIQLTATDDGINGLKISASNPANNITTETHFTFELTYTQAAINNKAKVTEQANYKPLAVSTLVTIPPASITQTTAVSGGNITSDGGSSVTSRGVCWSTNANPTIANDKTTDGSGTGNFTSTISGLTQGQTYYVRAYAINSAGTAYGNEVSFKTLPSATFDLNKTSWVLKWCDVTNYIITFSTDTSGTSQTFSQNGSTFTLKRQFLPPYNCYIQFDGNITSNTTISGTYTYTLQYGICTTGCPLTGPFTGVRY